MKNVLLFSFFSFCMAASMKAQITTSTAESVKDKPYKIVFQLATGDTMVQIGLVRQINNALTAAPKSNIEVVCHSDGITFLESAKTKSAEGIKALKAKGVVFAACENSMKSHHLNKSEMIGEAVYVPSGVVELADKQMAGWSYVKAGY